jgi:hypothetical protein
MASNQHEPDRPSDRRKHQKPPRQSKRSKDRGPEDGISVRRVPGRQAWELVYPPSVVRRREDMEEVRAMLAAGEIDVAIDELRWLLNGCRAILEAHKLLGEISLDEKDMPLAQAHLGYAYQLGLSAVQAERDFSGPLPYALPANRAFFEAGKGLARCLSEKGDAKGAVQVVRQLVDLDPTDPLGLKDWLASQGKTPGPGTR